MSKPNKNDAISNLVSGVAWSMKGEEISHWDINNVGIAQPTDEAINTELTKLQTDYKHIEELAREKYRMSKKGERVFKVIEKENNN